MARVAWTARLRPDRIADYEAAHADVWPEVLELIKRAGVRNYSIYRHEDRVFGYYECDDPDGAEAVISAGQDKIGWATAMAKLFMPEVSERGPDSMPEIFRLD